MFNQTINPVILNLGFISIRYYGLIYALGLLALVYWLSYNKKKYRLNIDPVDLSIYLFIGLLIGARLGHCFIYNAKFYMHNPLLILAFWKGGMSFYGGIIGVFIAAYIYSRKKHIDLWLLADIVVVIAPLFLGLGRIANFINSELYGKITSVPWCVYFPNVYGCRHPVQLYESIKNFFVFGVIWVLKDKEYIKRHKGLLFAIFLMLYSSLRFILDFYRDEPVIFHGLMLNHFLSMALFIIGLVLAIRFTKNEGENINPRKSSKK